MRKPQEMRVWSLDQEEIPWRREWESSPEFFPEKSYGKKSLMGYSPKGCKELDNANTIAIQIQLNSMKAGTFFYSQNNTKSLELKLVYSI